MNNAQLDPRDAQSALDAINVDRHRLAARFTAETWWAAPAQALAIAALIFLASAAFVAMLIGVVIYDRAYALDLRRVR